MDRRRRERVGRIIGGVGAICASVFWGFLLFAVASLLMEPRGLKSLALIFAMPMGALASVLFVVSVADLIVLVRRVDVGMPWRVAATHVVMAIVFAWMRDFGREGLLTASIPLAVAATQVIAIRLFQITPSHAASQR